MGSKPLKSMERYTNDQNWNWKAGKYEGNSKNCHMCVHEISDRPKFSTCGKSSRWNFGFGFPNSIQTCTTKNESLREKLQLLSIQAFLEQRNFRMWNQWDFPFSIRWSIYVYISRLLCKLYNYKKMYFFRSIRLTKRIDRLIHLQWISQFIRRGPIHKENCQMKMILWILEAYLIIDYQSHGLVH